MAASNGFTKQKLKLIVHGNQGFESSQLLKLLPNYKKRDVYETEEFEILPFSDLNIDRKFPLFKPNPKLETLIQQSDEGVKISAILVLISLTEIFSDGMHTLILKLPQDNFYGFDKASEKEWWSRVIVVFSFETNNEKNNNQVKMSIDGNGGLKSIVQRVGRRYFWVSKQTTSEELIEQLIDKLPHQETKLVLGEPHSKGYDDLTQSFRKVLKNFSETPEIKNLYERFILIGEGKSGKTTLGNLLLGPREVPLFGKEWYYKPSGKPKKYQIGDVEINSKWLYGSKCNGSKSFNIKIQIVDEPDSLTPKQYGEFLGNCLSEFNKTVFLICVNLTTGILSNEDFLRIMDISKMFSIGCLDFFSKSMIIFTHMDEFVESKKEIPKEMEQLLHNNSQSYIHKLLTLVNWRYLWINGMNISDKNRNEFMNDLLKFFKSVTYKKHHSKGFHLIPSFEADPSMAQKYQIHVLPVVPERCRVGINLPAEQSNAKQEEQKQSNCRGETTKDEMIDRKDEESQIEVEKEVSAKFQALKNYQEIANLIHKSLNCNQAENKELHHMFSLNNIETEMREVLKELSRMGSTKARVVVINFEEIQIDEIYLKLSYLSEGNNFNNCTLIAFKIQCEVEKSINEKIPKIFNRLVEAASSRYIFLTEPNRNSEKKQKLPSDQQLQNSIYSANSKEDTNEELALKEKLDKKETECNQTSSESKVFLSHNFVFSSNEPNKLLFSYFLLDEIGDHEDITGDSGPQ